MRKSNKVKFFLAAATLMIGFTSAFAATPAQEDETEREQQERASQYDWGGDPNSEIGAPGTSVVDTALDKPVAVNCHDCDVANQYAGPRSRTFEAHGELEKKGGSTGGSSEDAKQ